jgi:hypothetical protein
MGDEKLVEAALEALDNSMEKIKNFTKLALSVDCDTVVRLWRDELARRLLIGESALPLIYGCNDVLQESKGATNDAFSKSFKKILVEEFQAVVSNQPESKSSIEKVLRVWGERQVLDKGYLRKLRKCLNTESSERYVMMCLENYQTNQSLEQFLRVY